MLKLDPNYFLIQTRNKETDPIYRHCGKHPMNMRKNTFIFFVKVWFSFTHWKTYCICYWICPECHAWRKDQQFSGKVWDLLPVSTSASCTFIPYRLTSWKARKKTQQYRHLIHNWPLHPPAFLSHIKVIDNWKNIVLLGHKNKQITLHEYF